MNNEEYKAHSIFGPGNCLYAICMTKKIAEDYAKKFYKPGSYTVRKSTSRDFEELANGIR